MDKKECIMADEIAQKERELRERVENTQMQGSDHLYSKLKMEFHSWNYEEKSITIRFPVREWELNHMGSMHGGIIAVAVDTVSGMATSHFSDCRISPTINMNINYLLPALDGDAILVTAKIDHLGKRLVNLTTICRSEKSGKTLATATVNFILMGNQMPKSK